MCDRRDITVCREWVTHPAPAALRALEAGLPPRAGPSAFEAISAPSKCTWEMYGAFQDRPASFEDMGSLLTYGHSVLNPSISREVVKGVCHHPPTKG